MLTVHWYHANSSPFGPEFNNKHFLTFLQNFNMKYEDERIMQARKRSKNWSYAPLPGFVTLIVLNPTSSGFLRYTLQGSMLTTTACNIYIK